MNFLSIFYFLIFNFLAIEMVINKVVLKSPIINKRNIKKLADVSRRLDRDHNRNHLQPLLSPKRRYNETPNVTINMTNRNTLSPIFTNFVSVLIKSKILIKESYGIFYRRRGKVLALAKTFKQKQALDILLKTLLRKMSLCSAKRTYL